MQQRTIRDMARAALRDVLLVLLAWVLAIGMFTVMTGIAGAAPVANPYVWGQASYWAWQNRTDLPPNLGAPHRWDEEAEARGWPVSGYPRKGDVAVFEPGVYGVGATGHLAVVEQVYEDGTYIASQMDERECNGNTAACGQVSRRRYETNRGISFIHHKKDTRTTWSFAAGAAGWKALNLAPGNMGGPGWFYPLAGNDPQLISPELDVPLDGYNAIEVEMVTGVTVADPTIQVFFSTAGEPGFYQARSATFGGQADGKVRRYVFNFGAHPSWKGQLSGLRLDPAGAGTNGGVRVDRVRLLRLETQSGSFSALTDRPDSGAGRSRARP